MGEGVKGIYKAESSVHLVLGAYICILFASGSKATLYIQVLSSGQSKK